MQPSIDAAYNLDVAGETTGVSLQTLWNTHRKKPQALTCKVESVSVCEGFTSC